MELHLWATPEHVLTCLLSIILLVPLSITHFVESFGDPISRYKFAVVEFWDDDGHFVLFSS